MNEWSASIDIRLPQDESHPASAGPPRADPRVTDELLRRRAEADEEEAELLTAEVIRQHLPLVLSLAARYRNHGEAWEDLVQVAGLGLVLAVQRYRVDIGVPFLGYAIPTILGELRRYLRDYAWAIKPPRRLQELRPVVLAAQERLTHQLGRQPTVTEVAEEAEADLGDAAEALTLSSAYQPESIEALTVRPGESAATLTTANRSNTANTAMTDVDTRLAVAPALADLSPPARRALHLYYIESRTQREIGEEIGVSQMQVSRLLKGARESLARTVDPQARN